MQIVTNKVENGYICTKDGKMYVFGNLTEVSAFLITEFNEPIIPDLLNKLLPTNLPNYNELITSNSE